MDKSYTALEQMMVCGARQIEDGDALYVGVGFPMVACWLAKGTHAPNAAIVHENGIIRMTPPPDGKSAGSMAMQAGHMLVSTLNVNCMLANGFCNKGFLGCGQVDRHGNINSTAVGDYHNPIHRWPGSGGANDVMTYSPYTILILEQSRRRFLERVDFLTSPGYFDGLPGQREQNGLPQNTGPRVLVSNMGIYRFVDGEMVLISYHGDLGITIDDVRRETGWDLKVAADVRITEPPTEKELDVLRHQVGMPPG
jgi:glutaconate CoA-transferase subunit B